MRSAQIERETAETQIAVSLNIDGSGTFGGTTGIGFFDHMMNLLACHSGMDITLHVHGDLDVDTHHTIEDLAIVFDEALTRVVIDLSGRPYLVYDVKLAVERIGTFETEMLKEFLYALAVHGRMNLHVTNLYGENAHHIVESVFKGLGHALKEAVRIEGDETSVLSTKGVL